ncbi:unnamed protein product [Orchesella dallaii]|uniref:Uncharacterized protein n=1 Tax=Orchesella dallaii TaxID=48710 RepID=A0ABP1RV67_9HEXA
MALFGSEFQNFINSAYKFEQAHGHEMQLAQSEKFNNRILSLTKAYVYLMRYPGTRMAPIVISTIAAVAPNLPINFLSFPPGKYMTEIFVFVSTSCNICWPLHYVFVAITFAINWAAWQILIKYSVLNLNQINCMQAL